MDCCSHCHQNENNKLLPFIYYSIPNNFEFENTMRSAAALVATSPNFSTSIKADTSLISSMAFNFSSPSSLTVPSSAITSIALSSTFAAVTDSSVLTFS